MPTDTTYCAQCAFNGYRVEMRDGDCTRWHCVLYARGYKERPAWLTATGIVEPARSPSVATAPAEPNPNQTRLDSLGLTRDFLGERVREAWVRWARTQPNPKPHWLAPWEELSEADKEADRQIGVSIALFTILHYAATLPEPVLATAPGSAAREEDAIRAVEFVLERNRAWAPWVARGLRDAVTALRASPAVFVQSDVVGLRNLATVEISDVNAAWMFSLADRIAAALRHTPVPRPEEGGETDAAQREWLVLMRAVGRTTPGPWVICTPREGGQAMSGARALALLEELAPEFEPTFEFRVAMLQNRAALTRDAARPAGEDSR